jgi:NAD(P)-dependent dehydrogenase (short-subunit alcohol dehydrogenase family)
MAKLQGKRAFVTGAGRGIGADIAAKLASEGAIVAVADIDADTAQQTASAIPNAVAVTVDVTDRTAVTAAIDAFAADGGLDILVNNAVYFNYALHSEMTEEIVTKMLDVGIKGTFWATQAATPHIKAQGGGSIIMLSSIAVSLGIARAGVYTSIKGAVDAFTRQQADELGPVNIRVNALAPGPVKTPGASTVINDENWEKRKNMSPIQRLVTGEEVGAAAVFLASDDAKGITGVTIKIDNGITISGPK